MMVFWRVVGKGDYLASGDNICNNELCFAMFKYKHERTWREQTSTKACNFPHIRLFCI